MASPVVSPPPEADVVVAGAGPAGASCALHLLETDPSLRVCLLERFGPPRPRGRSGVAFASPDPDLGAALAERGEERLRREIGLHRAGLEHLESFARLAGEGRIGYARVRVERRFFDREAERTHAAIARRLGVPEEEAVVDADALASEATRLAVAKGARFHPGVTLARIEPGGDEWLQVAGESPEGTVRMRALRVVLAMGAWLGPFDTWTSEIALPAAAVSVTIESTGSPSPAAFALGPGFVWGRRAADGRVVAAEGHRPANRGDPFADRPDPGTTSRLVSSLHEHLGLPVGPEKVRAAPSARLHTCDGLPLVGPHPGRSSTLLLAGFGGHDEALALLAGRFAAEILLEGRASHPDAALWSPRRML